MEGTLHTEKISPLESVLNLKKATVADIPVLLELEKSVSGVNTYSAMLEENEWEDELQDGTVYFLVKCGTNVGYVSYAQRGDDSAYISGLVVDPRFRGRGIAREALTQVLNELRDFKRVDLVTHPDNKAAIGLYQSLGFVVESRKENHFGDGEPRLVLVLKK